jgi:cytochrome b pre-mRNA-processing protein 3
VLASLFSRSDDRQAARKLYLGVVAQARDPVFYAKMGVPDTVDGRFDMIALHAWLVMRRLKPESAAARVSQALFDVLFDDMDRSLRESGAGDLGVGRRVKTMAKAFYGRIAAYDEGLAGDEDALAAAVGRNLYRGADPGAARLAAVAGYIRCEAAALEAQDLEDLLGGRVTFGPPPAAAADRPGAI